MPTRKQPTAPAKPVPVRLDAELIAEIDAIKDPDASRERFVRRLVREALDARARKAAKR